jgi:hypothetical protein
MKGNEMGRACSTHGKKVLVEEPEGNTQLGRPRYRWRIIRMDADLLRALANTVMNLRVSYSVEKFLSGLATTSCSRKVG